MRIRPKTFPGAGDHPTWTETSDAQSMPGRGKGGVTLTIPASLESEIDDIFSKVSALGLQQGKLLRSLGMITGEASPSAIDAISVKIPGIAIDRSGTMRVQ